MARTGDAVEVERRQPWRTSAKADLGQITINSNRSATLKKFLAVTIVVLSALSLASSAAQASTIGQREALEAAKSYLRSGHFPGPV
jgi:hypothetical protein